MREGGDRLCIGGYSVTTSVVEGDKGYSVLTLTGMFPLWDEGDPL